MADSADTQARRTALARRIGEEMRIASKQKKERYASAQLYENNGAFANANRARGQADAAFSQARKRMTSALKAGGI